MFTVLYTHQKTKKSKTWQDGTLQRISKTKLNLLCDKGRFLDSVYNSTDVSVGDEIESDRYILTIEGLATAHAALTESKENSHPQSKLFRPPQPPPQAKLCPRFEKPGSKVGKKFVPPISKNSFKTPERHVTKSPHQPAASSLFTSLPNKCTNRAGVYTPQRFEPSPFQPSRFEPSPFQPSQNFKASLEADSQQFQESLRPDKPVIAKPAKVQSKCVESAPPPTQKRTLEDIFAVFEPKLDPLTQPSYPSRGDPDNQPQSDTSCFHEQPEQTTYNESQQNVSLSQRMNRLQTLIENNKSTTLEHSPMTCFSTFDIEETEDLFSPQEPQSTACKTADQSLSAPSSVSSDGLSSYINNMIDDLPSQTTDHPATSLDQPHPARDPPPPGYLSQQSPDHHPSNKDPPPPGYLSQQSPDHHPSNKDPGLHTTSPELYSNKDQPELPPGYLPQLVQQSQPEPPTPKVYSTQPEPPTPKVYSTQPEPPPGYLSESTLTDEVNRSFSDNIMSCLDEEDDLTFEESIVEDKLTTREYKGQVPSMSWLEEDLNFDETFVEEKREEVKEVMEGVNWWLEEEIELEEEVSEEIISTEDDVSNIQSVQNSNSVCSDKAVPPQQRAEVTHNSVRSDKAVPPQQRAEVTHFETIDYFNMFEIEEKEVEIFSPVEPNTQSDECTDQVNRSNPDVTDSVVQDEPQIAPGYLSESYQHSPNMPSTAKRGVEEVVEKIDNKRRRFEVPGRARDVEATRVFTPAETKPKGFSSPFLLGCDMRLNRSSSTQKLLFPKKEGIIKHRQISIPSTFSTAAQYRDCMLSVIYEHLNVSMGMVAEKYYSIPLPSSNEQGPSCPHGKAKLCSVNKPGPNKGRSFYSCPKREGGCKLFEWVANSAVPCLRTAAEYHQYYNTRGVSYYSECSLERKAQSNHYLLKLSVLDKHTAYNKDDVWFVCPQRANISSNGCLMQSTFYGPNSRGSVELRVLGDTIPGCSGKVHCIQVLKNCAELEIISSIESKLSSLPLVPALLDKRASGEPLQFSVEAPVAVAERLCHKYSLNEGQHEAVLALLHSIQGGPPILLIHGVFGSGKSYLLAVMVLILVEVLRSSERVVISSTTNVAVDNVLVRLLDFGFTDFLRVGSMKKINKRIAPYVLQHQEPVECHYSVKQQQNEGILNRVQVVGTTCASSLSITNHSIVLLDESSQITEPSSLLPILQAGCKRVVLVGDPMQLPPTIESPSATQSGLERTLFNRAEAMGYPNVMLSEQYRCHPVISSLSNTLFYKGTLRDGVTSDDRAALVPLQPLVFISTEGSESHSGDSYCNNKEAASVVELVRLLEKQGISKEQVAVITLYRGQEALLKKSLGNSRTLKVSTVDAIQGAERDIVILSCVRTSKIGFGDCPKRVNVALSRAKHHLIILGNLSMLSGNSLWGNIVQMCADRKSVMTQEEVFTALSEK